MKTDQYSLRHHAQRIAKDADQVEFMALRTGSAAIDSGTYSERVAAAWHDFEVYDISRTERWNIEDLRQDDAVGRVHEELERRRKLMDDGYPFSIRGGTLIHTPRLDENSIYEFMLSICNAKSLTSGQYVDLPRVFERLSARLVASYFGTRSEFLHTGWPRDKETGSSFKDAMLTLNNRTAEWTWSPQDGLPNCPTNGDGGCDFVVWSKPADGRRIGQLFILGQCACGNDWDTKLTDLVVRDLEKWFNPLSTVDPVRCFTTPFHVTDAMLKEASRKGGIVFDRARLVSISHFPGMSVIEPGMSSDMDSLVTLVME